MRRLSKFILKILIIGAAILAIVAIVELTNFMNDDTFWDAVTSDPIEESTDHFYNERY